MTNNVARGVSLARNTLLNLAGQAVPLLIAVVSIPLVVRGLGPDRFGVLSLAWAVLGYFTLFEFGLSRATTKFVAEIVKRAEKARLGQLVWTSLLLHVVFGIVGGLTLAGLTPILLERVFKISSTLLDQARATFYLMALAVPVVILSASARSVLEGLQRFDLVNLIKAPANSLLYLIPAVAVQFGVGLPGIVALILASRVIGAIAYFGVCLRIVPSLAQHLRIGTEDLRSLLSFGGWVSVSNVIGPILIYFDRFLLGSVLSMAAVAYYVAPYEAVTRLWIIPASLASTLLPEFSALGTSDARKSTEVVFTRSLKYGILAMTPVVAVVALFAREIVHLWLGQEYVGPSTLVLQVLAVGIFFHSMAYVPWTLLQAIGRPDLTSKFHLVHLLPYLGLAWVFVRNHGVAGAAVAWALRALADGLFHLVAAWRSGQMAEVIGRDRSLQAAILQGVILVGIALAMGTQMTALYWRIAVLAATLAVFVSAGWYRALDEVDRKFFGSLAAAAYRKVL